MGLNEIINALNGILFSNYTVYALLATGVLFTFWSGFGQYRALTHGVSVVRGKYDDKNDPGAINHFQALSAALSATVGLGNIAGVAVAVGLGGPGAILWMWVIGIIGMALKMTEVTQSMLYRDTDDPENPHGGPMFVVKKGLADSVGLRYIAAFLFAAITIFLTYLAYGAFDGSIVAIVIGVLLALTFIVMGFLSGKAIGTMIGTVFVITLVISAITGGNMFQAWNVGDITFTYFGVPQIATGIILTVLVGMVIIGGIKRIGSVAGKIVPFMCIIYMAAAGYVLILHIGELPSMIGMIVKSGLPSFLGGAAPDATGAFLGGTFGYAAIWGVKRALFSSEAGQGSSPIAHSAAKTDEPVREGVVAGLEPFIDTIVVCTMTALVIFSTGAYNRESEANFTADSSVAVAFVSEQAAALPGNASGTSQDTDWSFESIPVPSRLPTAVEQAKSLESGEPTPAWKRGDDVFVYVEVQPGDRTRALHGSVVGEKDGPLTIEFDQLAPKENAAPFASATQQAALYHGDLPRWTLETGPLPQMTDDAKRIRRTAEGQSGWRDGETIFIVVEADRDDNTGRDLRRISGTVVQEPSVGWSVEWGTLESEIEPFFRSLEDGTPDTGLYGDYAGASLTAYAFDRAAPGLGKIVVSIAAWLFALSTMISWSYYGEQGIYFIFSWVGDKRMKLVILIYKVIYCSLILLTGAAAMKIFPAEGGGKKALIGTDIELDMWTTLGLGVMLVANIPIMLLFGAQAMKAHRAYFKKMKAGGDPPHDAPPFSDVVEGKDVE